MNDEEKIWRGKADEEVLAAARRLAEYTEEGEGVIRAEVRRRGFDEPPPTIRHSDPSVGPQTGISDRYTDAYRVASALIAFGITVKVIGAAVAVIIVVASIASFDSLVGGFASTQRDLR